jgi:TRAP-type C4-dicarboxylate transport system permease large subunit
MDKFALVVVLYFILCGNIMTAGTIVDKLIKVANVLVSWLPGEDWAWPVLSPAAFLAPYPVPRSPRWWHWVDL